MPKRILLYAIGSAGHVYPFVGIGRQLKESGFRVVLITSQYFEAQTRSAGLAASFCKTWIVQPDRCPRGRA